MDRTGIIVVTAVVAAIGSVCTVQFANAVDGPATSSPRDCCDYKTILWSNFTYFAGSHAIKT